jgi:hypothetical protein
MRIRPSLLPVRRRTGAGVIPLIVGILVAYFFSAELAKAPFFRRFDV